MGFNEAKAGLVQALRSSNVRFEARSLQDTKNVLLTGKLSLSDAADIVQLTRGTQASSSTHHADSTIMVWVFKPGGWYVKFYFDEDAVVISFHKQEEQP